MRKNVLILLPLVFFLGAGIWIARAQQPAAPSKLEKIKDDLYVITGDGGNTTVYLTNAGVILVDAKFERDHDDIMDKVKSLTDKPIKYVISTHPHGDHTGGNEKMRPFAVIVGHSDARADMIRDKQPGAPEVTFGDEMSINLGGKEVLARHFSPAHTNGDVVVYFPALKVVAMGDTFNTGAFGVHIDYKSGGSIMEWTKTLDGALKWDFDTVVPGHGPMATRDDLIKFRAAVDATRIRVRAMVRDGKTKDDVAKVLINEFGWNPMGIGIRNDVPGLMDELKP
jgi:cyclase